MYLLRLSDVAKYVMKRLKRASPVVVYFNVGRVAVARESTSYWQRLTNKDLKFIGRYDNSVSEAAVLEDLIYYFEGLPHGLEWLWTTDFPPREVPKWSTPHHERWRI